MSTASVSDLPDRSGNRACMSALREIREAKGLTQKQLAELLNTTDVSVSRYEKEESRLTLPLLRKMARELRCTVADLIGETDERGEVQRPERQLIPEEERRFALIGELDITATAGGGTAPETTEVSAEWGFPVDWVRYEMRARPVDLSIISVEGDSMSPTILPGDKVVVNRGARSPSPPGLFVLWDGLGLVAKRLEHIPRSDPPRVRIMSDNERYRPYEATAEEVEIVGRIVGRWERL